MNILPVSEAELHAYVDGLLTQERSREIENYLAGHPEEAQRVHAWAEQKKALHGLYDAVLSEPVPANVSRSLARERIRPLLPYAQVALGLLVGVGLGWYMHGYSAAKSVATMGFAHQAAIAHAIYSPEVRHPVEVGADQEAHLVAWLSKRLDASLTVPRLAELGYQLIGGRLLPSNQGPVAQFMYQDGNGQRLTLYVKRDSDVNDETAFRYSEERGVRVFYWIDGKFGYALSGAIPKAELLHIAQAVYQQLNP